MGHGSGSLNACMRMRESLREHSRQLLCMNVWLMISPFPVLDLLWSGVATVWHGDNDWQVARNVFDEARETVVSATDLIRSKMQNRVRFHCAELVGGWIDWIHCLKI